MSQCRKYSGISDQQAAVLVEQGCVCSDWKRVYVAEGFDCSAVRNAVFIGDVLIGCVSGVIADAFGNKKDCGIYNAVIKNCSIGDGCRICGIGIHIAGYDIADGVCIEDAGRVESRSEAVFGNGVAVSVLNEAGGREVSLFDGLTAQFAYMQCVHRYRPGVVKKMNDIAADHIESSVRARGMIGSGARISSCCQIVDVNIGAGSIINGASRLVNGTILGGSDRPSRVGGDVVAEDFIIAEGGQVDSGAVLEKVYVGQGCLIGKGFNAENCLFFANSEMFAGEACSVFGGPYTVSHHKSTLLIAGLFSFYNAGSGTNQSNHMYRLGPGHEGKLLRGAKTGSLSYMLWPSVAGAFSVVLGKHSCFFDAGDFPFSRIIAGSDGESFIVPAVGLVSCGVARDSLKWPVRERRGESKRDAVSFAVMSPYTVGMMIEACGLLKGLLENPDKKAEVSDKILFKGAIIKRTDAVSGLNLYREAVELYLLEKIFDRLKKGKPDVESDSIYCDKWVDVGGMLVPAVRLEVLREAVENGNVKSVEDFDGRIAGMNQFYGVDEWAWVVKKFSEIFGFDVSGISKTEMDQLGERLILLKSKFVDAIVADAGKEYSARSCVGFGIDGSPADAEKDFREVKGTLEDNTFIRQMKEELEDFKKKFGRV